MAVDYASTPEENFWGAAGCYRMQFMGELLGL
jgi:hypothetical protein